jgi:hypothetical protein
MGDRSLAHLWAAPYSRPRRAQITLVKYVPSWFPGADFKRIAQEYRATIDEFIDLPWAWVKDQVVRIFLSRYHHLSFKRLV